MDDWKKMEKKPRLLLFLFLNFFTVFAAHAFSFSSWYAEKKWHPVFTLGAGTSTSSHVGNSKNFPILNFTTEEFYNYSAYKPTQTSFLFDIFLGIEKNWQPNWGMQAGVDYNQASSFSAKGTFIQGADALSADSYSYHYDVLTRQLLFEGKLFYILKDIYRPYILAGIGAAFNKTYHFYTNVPPDLTFTRMYADNSTTSFSYAFGLGVDIDITCNFRAGVGYRFADLGQAKLGDAIIDTTSVSGTLSQSHLYANELLAQLTWIFS